MYTHMCNHVYLCIHICMYIYAHGVQRFRHRLDLPRFPSSLRRYASASWGQRWHQWLREREREKKWVSEWVWEREGEWVWEREGEWVCVCVSVYVCVYASVYAKNKYGVEKICDLFEMCDTLWNVWGSDTEIWQFPLKHAASPQSTESRSLDSSVSRGTNSNRDGDLIWICAKESDSQRGYVNKSTDSDNI